MIKTLHDILLKAKSGEPRNIVVAAAEDINVLEAIKIAMAEEIVNPILIGNKKRIEEIASGIDFNLNLVELINEDDPIVATQKAVKFVADGKAEILMKGLIGTSDLLKAILNKEYGIRKYEVLSHVSVFESPYYHKLLGISDVAMNISPDLKEKVAIIHNALTVMHSLGVVMPKVAVLAAVELVNPAMQATIDAAALSMMNRRKQIRNCIIDGPLALDNAISAYSAKVKGIDSEVAGDADLLIVNDLEAGNNLYKSLSFLGGATVAAVIMGAKVPVVLTSRADNDQSKLMSIALAACIK